MAPPLQRKQGPTPAHPPRRSVPPPPPASPWPARLSLALGALLVVASLLAAWLQPLRPEAVAARPGQPAWWLHPLERNPELRLQRISGDLAGIFVLPGSERLWVVGQRGLILHSADGGRHWQQQHPVPAPRTGTGQPPAPGPVSWLEGLVPAAHAVDAPMLKGEPEPATNMARQATPRAASAEEAKQAEVQRAPPPSPQVQAKAPRVTRTATPAPPSPPQAARPIPADADLVAVHFDNGQRGWAASPQGIALITVNGGANWTQPGNAAELYRLFPGHADRLRALLQAGATPPATHIPADLLASASDGPRRWAVGRNGTILASADGGQTWQRQTRGDDGPPGASHARLPAPWTYVAFLLGVGLWLRAGRQLERPPQSRDPVPPGIAGLFVSDHPLGPGDPDPLGYNLVAQGLANFILNRNTEPGITLAITGQWGTGKSSIMRLLLYRLEEAGFRPAWFNAWHHQQEGRQLASLFNAIRRQAMPPWYTPAAWWARLALYWGRGWFYRLLALGLLALAVLLGIEAARDFPGLRRTLVSAVIDTRQVVLTPASLKQLDAQAGKPLDEAILAALRGNLLWSQEAPGAGACRVAGGDCVFANTAQLLNTLEAHLKPRLLTDEERSAIAAAAQHLGPAPRQDILAVLLSALVLPLLLGKGLAVYGINYLDLLKRLLPERGRAEGKEAVGTMEHLRAEFALLTEALDGRLVLFIDDLDRCSCQTVREVLELVNYLASVGQCFIVLGMAMEHVACCIEPKSSDQERAAYALQYLKKLINIEVPVPAMDPDRSQQMLARQASVTQRPEGPGAWREWLAPGLLVLGVLLLSLALPRLWQQFQPDTAARLITPPAMAATVADAAGSAPVPAAAAPLRVGIDTPAPSATAWWLGAPPALILAGLAAWFSRGRWLGWLRGRGLLPALRRALGQAVRKDDSADFAATLLEWHPVILKGDTTPRGVKRFVNRVRFLAMMELSQAEEERIPDPLLVALAALHHAGLEADSDDPQARAAREKTPHWPPGPAQLARFDRLMRQLHIR